jgi:hypothetical protein
VYPGPCHTLPIALSRSRGARGTTPTAWLVRRAAAAPAPALASAAAAAAPPPPASLAVTASQLALSCVLHHAPKTSSTHSTGEHGRRCSSDAPQHAAWYDAAAAAAAAAESRTAPTMSIEAVASCIRLTTFLKTPRGKHAQPIHCQIDRVTPPMVSGNAQLKLSGG